MKRKILIVPSWYPSSSAPISGIFVEEQALVLSQNYDVAVLAPAWVGWRALLRGEAAPKAELEQRAGLMVYRQKAFVPLPGSRWAAYQSYARAVRHGFENLRSFWGKPDLIHAHVVLPAGWAASRLGKQYGIPVILTEHSGPFSMNLQTDYERTLVREALAQVNHIVAVSPAMEQQILAFQPVQNIHVVGNVIRTDFFSPAQKQDPDSSEKALQFLAVASLTEQKGLHYLLEAGKLLLERGLSKFGILIAGDGPQRGMLEEQAQASGLSQHCHFLGALEPIQVRHRMQESDVFVLPSLAETFGVVLVEAMACGIPVIATRSGGPEFVVTPETGVLVDVADPAALADAMEGFIVGQFQYDPQSIRNSVRDRFGEIAFLQRISALYSQVLA